MGWEDGDIWLDVKMWRCEDVVGWEDNRHFSSIRKIAMLFNIITLPLVDDRSFKMLPERHLHSEHEHITTML